MRILAMSLCLVFSGLAFADDLNCQNKMGVVYSPGPNWSRLQEFLPLHLDFITARLKAGDMFEAGPFLGDQGPTGGFMVYNSEDLTAVEKMVKEDPFVSNMVANFELRLWMKCTAN